MEKDVIEKYSTNTAIWGSGVNLTRTPLLPNL